MQIVKMILVILSLAVSTGVMLFLGGWGAVLAVPLMIVALLACLWLQVVPVNQILITESLFTHQILQLLQPGWHLVMLPFEREFETVSTLPELVEFISQEVGTSDGIPFAVQVGLVFKLDPHSIPVHKRTETITSVLEDTHGTVQRFLDHAVRDVFIRRSSLQLIKSLDRTTLSRTVIGRARDMLQPLGVSPVRLLLGQIAPPADLQLVVVDGISRVVGVSADKAVLPTLAGIGASMSDREQAWTLNLEERRILAEGGAALIVERDAHR